MVNHESRQDKVDDWDFLKSESENEHPPKKSESENLPTKW